jgi:hypothetical protein
MVKKLPSWLASQQPDMIHKKTTENTLSNSNIKTWLALRTQKIANSINLLDI